MINKLKTFVAGATILASALAYGKMVEVKEVRGMVKVNTNPQRVVALDNRTFETLQDWGIKPVAVPKDVLPFTSKFKNDDSIPNIGNHREPNLELIAAVNPDLIIVGQRFGKYTKQIQELVPTATVIDLNWIVKGEGSGKNLIEGLKTSTETLGKIFEKEKEAVALNKKFDEAIDKAKKAYNPKDKVMAVNVNDKKIGYIAPVDGRVFGPMFEVFNWTPALKVKNASNNHKGDDISVEAIASSNPDIIFVMDRNAGVSDDGKYLAASEVIAETEALKNVKAIKNGKVIYAPADTYTNESIQTYIELFENIAKSLSK